MTDPKICILVLNWNGARDTIECVASLKKLTFANAVPVVIDNGSGDNSVQLIREAHNDVHIIELESNLMYGGGNNAGLQWAEEHDFDFVVFLNNDTTVEPDFLGPLIAEFDKSTKIGMTAPLMCYYDTPDLIWYGGGYVSLWAGIVEHKNIRKDLKSIEIKTQETDYVTGCCLMMPTKLAVELGGFDPSFKMYAEDVDLSLRTRTAGYDLIFVPMSRIYHKVSASVGGEFSLKKFARKGVGLVRLFIKHASAYQIPTIIISQLLFLLYKVFTFTAQMVKPKPGSH